MTVMDAISVLNRFEECVTVKANGAYETDKWIHAKALAIAALEKQIPKEPDFEGDGYADGHMVYDTWICPNCGAKHEVDYEEYPHCTDCGQAIFWNRLKYADNETAQSGLMPAT